MIVDETIVRKKVAQADLKEEAEKVLGKAIVRKAVEKEVFSVIQY